ncbi:MAG TPA: membrane dipeptidase [Steroidobacteraceae bacterium]|nr:membrane dipeptidase [Steroidobacteraceae bacterium]
MQRREFVLGAALAGTASGVAAPLLAQETGRRSAPQAASPVSAGDRSTTRDPLALQRSTLVVDGLDVSNLNERYVQLLQQGGVNCWHKSMGDLDSFSDLYRFVDDHPELAVARTVREIRDAHARGKVALIFGWQDADLLAGRVTNPMLGAPRTSLRGYYELGLRIVGFAYNLTNVFGAGNMEGHVPLSRAGRVLVEEAHKLNVLLDVGGHTGERTSLDVIAMSAGRPVICSHTNVGSIADNPRNVSDRLIDAIAGTGGVIGLTAVNDFHVRRAADKNVAHSPRVGVSAFVDQMEYLKKRVGVDHIGLGPDFVEGRTLDYDTINQSLAINREIISDGQWLYIQSFENISQLPNVTREMIARGWSTGEIHKLLGENWLRVYRAAWGA